MEAGLITSAILTRDASDGAQTHEGTFGHASCYSGAGAGNKERTGGSVGMTLPAPIIG